MAEKRYWWLKLPEDFFGSKRVKRLRKEDDGDTLLIIYLKLQLLAVKSDGRIEFEGLEDSFVDELALDIEESSELVGRCLTFLVRTGLAEQPDARTIIFPWVRINTGSESASAARVRKLRSQQDAASQNAQNVTPERYIVTPERNEVTHERYIVTESKNKSKSKSKNLEVELEPEGELDNKQSLNILPLDGRKDMPAPPDCAQGFVQGNMQSFQQALEQYPMEPVLPGDDRPDWLKRVDELAAEGEAIVDAALARRSTGRQRYF